MNMSQAQRCLPPLCWLGLAVLFACSAQHGPRGGRGSDATPEASSLGKLVHEVFSEMERDAELRCVCYVADGAYPSEEDCMDEVGRGASTIGCLEQALQAAPEETLRAPFECMLLALKETNACLETATCDDPLGLCFAAPHDCPTPDPVLLTQLSRQCPGAIGAAR
jgi:hypothetical protein